MIIVPSEIFTEARDPARGYIYCFLDVKCFLFFIFVKEKVPL